MKFTVIFKTPDALDDGIKTKLSYMSVNEEDTKEDHIAICDDMVYEMKKLAEKFISYGEIITIEFDTEKETARVLPKSRF